MTLDEYNQVHDGMTLAQVQAIFGRSTWQDHVTSTSAEGRTDTWHLMTWQNIDGSSATIDFHNGITDAESENNLR